MIEPDLLAQFGPFFAAGTHRRPLASPWRSMGELVTAAPALAERMAQVRAALAASGPVSGVEPRVAASVTQLGLTSRLTAPVLGLAVLGDPDPVLDLEDVYWQAELGGPFPLSLPEHLLPGGASPTPVDAPLRSFLEGPVRALVEATSALVPVAPHVLWGNVASTVHAAGQMIRTARPDLAARATAVTEAALAHPLLQAEHGRRQHRFRRRSCCLIYRIGASSGPRGVCADCVLDP